MNNDIIKKLLRAFGGQINNRFEFIADSQANEYFILGDCETELDVQCKVLEWLSRAAYKTCPYSDRRKNNDLHEKMLSGINEFLGTSFSESDMEKIYTVLGNSCNHRMTIEFVKSGFDLQQLL